MFDGDTQFDARDKNAIEKAFADDEQFEKYANAPSEFELTVHTKADTTNVVGSFSIAIKPKNV